MSDDKPIAGLLINPNARGNRKRPGLERRARRILGDDLCLVRTTRDVSEVETVLKEFRDAGVRELAVSGGDGAIHYLYCRWLELNGEDKPVPPLLVLGDGGMNMLFNDAGLKGTPEEVLGRWAKHLRLEHPLQRTRRSLIRVEFEDRRPVYCFTFTDGFIAKFVQKYLETDGGPVATVAMILKFVQDAVTRPDESYRNWYWPLDAAYRIDGQETVSGQTFCVASTIERLILNFSLFEHAPSAGNQMGFMTYWTQDLYKTAASLPLVMWGRGRLRSWGDDVKLRQFAPKAVEIQKCGLTVIDGEPYLQDRPVTCRLTLGPLVDVTVV